MRDFRSARITAHVGQFGCGTSYGSALFRWRSCHARDDGHLAAMKHLRTLSTRSLIVLVVAAAAALCAALAVAAGGGGPTPAPKPLDRAIHDALRTPPAGITARVEFTN